MASVVAEGLGRLRWRCRRGMRELDLVLESFLDRDYAGLSEADRACFARLLEYDDEVLAGCLLRGTPVSDPGLSDVVRAIRGIAARAGDTPAPT
ncbi:MAG: succinate dehydrogenase assembly factor 2 [Gammaproteobacteria bacterium]